MFQRILVPLDGSSRAEQALPVAARLAKASEGTVVLLRVVSTHNEFMLYPATYPEMVQGILETELEEAKSYLDRIARTSSLAEVHTEISVICSQVATAILSEVDERAIDLIVICSHGYTGVKRWMLGSVAEKVAHAAHVPVLLLREGDALLGTHHSRVEGSFRALIPLDGSVRAKAALAPAAKLIAALSAPKQGALHLTRVVVLPDAEQSARTRIYHA